MTPEEIREALAGAGNWTWMGDWVQTNETKTNALDKIVEAARLYALLLENGQEVQWCENHKAWQLHDFAGELRCAEWWMGESAGDAPLLDPYECRMVGYLVVPVQPEEER